MAYRITAYVTDLGSARAPMDHYVVCPVCGGRVGFNLAEMEARRAAGQNLSLRCWGGADPATGAEHWHPSSPFEAGTILAFRSDGD